MTHFNNWLRPEYGGIAALLLLATAGGARWHALARHPVAWLVLAFTAYAVLQAAYAARVTPAFSFAQHLSFNAKPIRVGVLACALGAWMADQPRRIPTLLGLMVAGFVVAALVCTPWADLAEVVSGALRLRLRYAENIVGEFAAMALLLVAVCAVSARSRRRATATAVRVVLLLAGVLLLACLLYAQSRAAWLAAVLVPLAACACLRHGRPGWRRSALVALGVTALAVVVALGTGYSLIAERLAGSDAIVDAMTHGALDELPASSVTMRMDLYSLAWRAWLAHPWFGIGLRGIQPLIAASGIHAANYVPPHLHSAYLEAMVGLGAVGAALILATFVLLVRDVWAVRRVGGAGATLCWALLGCLGIVLVVNVSDFLSWHNDYMRAPLELLLGCCFALSLRRRRAARDGSMQAVAAACDAIDGAAARQWSSAPPDVPPFDPTARRMAEPPAHPPPPQE